MRSAPAGTVGLALTLAALALAGAPPAGAGGVGAVVRVAVTGGAFTASSGLVHTFARPECAADDGRPTPLTALFDAARRYRLGGVWVRWDAATQDYVVLRIRGDAADSTRVWNAYVNEKKITTTPCRTAIKDRDKVRWTLEAPSGAAKKS
ncbi:hypothetical protein AB0C96_05005 [Streptomyces sp. NPDC048506]|uniref:hypothetical protein n=1 Tax=Streptomyces sp. NPDC048506 TaxID=3155028 RepID=UPI003442EE6D